MCFFFSLIPATMLTTVAYFVWFAAGQAQGSRRRWGSYLAVWLLVIALGIVSCGAYVTLAGLCPMERMLSEAATTA